MCSRPNINIKYLPILCVSAIMICIMSCNGEKISSLNVNTFEKSKSEYLTDDVNSSKCSVDLFISYIHGNDSLANKINKVIEKKLFGITDIKLNQAADSFVSQCFTDYKIGLSRFYAEDKNDPTKLSWYNYWYKIDTDVQQEKSEILTYIIRREYFEGGAHSIKTIQVINFDNATGNVININNVFAAGSENKLIDILLDKLKGQVGVNSINDLRQKGYLLSSDMYIPENFIIGEDDITFIYNVYELAPYEKGIIKIKIPYDEIKDILNRK